MKEELSSRSFHLQIERPAIQQRSSILLVASKPPSENKWILLI